VLIPGRIHGLPAEDTAELLALRETAARKNAAQVHYNHQRAARAARWLRERPERLPLPWADYCREVLEEDVPGWIDFLIENEAQLKGKGYAEARQALGNQGGQKGNTNASINHEPKSENEGVNNTFVRGSTNVGYLTARIARDRPDILERMKAGEFRSVRQAALEAGIVKPPSPLRELERWWGKATPEDRAAFAEWTRTADGSP
jgi:hypothetical protein